MFGTTTIWFKPKSLSCTFFSFPQLLKKSMRVNLTLKQRKIIRPPNKLQKIHFLQNHWGAKKMRRKVRRNLPPVQIKELNKRPLWGFSRRNDGGWLLPDTWYGHKMHITSSQTHHDSHPIQNSILIFPLCEQLWIHVVRNKCCQLETIVFFFKFLQDINNRLLSVGSFTLQMY